MNTFDYDFDDNFVVDNRSHGIYFPTNPYNIYPSSFGKDLFFFFKIILYLLVYYYFYNHRISKLSRILQPNIR